MARLLAARDEALLLTEDSTGVVCGLVHVSVYDTPARPTMVPRRRAHIDDLVVAARVRRRGIGRALVAAASDWARTKGAIEILLTVWAGNDAAEQFYAALGFAPLSQVMRRSL